MSEFHSKIVGVSRRNDDGTSRQEIIETCDAGELLLLIRDPENARDKNAVAVFRHSGEQLGYLSAEIAEDLAPRIDGGERLAAKITAITGEDQKFRGVNILIIPDTSVPPAPLGPLSMAGAISCAISIVAGIVMVVIGLKRQSAEALVLVGIVVGVIRAWLSLTLGRK